MSDEMRAADHKPLLKIVIYISIFAATVLLMTIILIVTMGPYGAATALFLFLPVVGLVIGFALVCYGVLVRPRDNIGSIILGPKEATFHNVPVGISIVIICLAFLYMIRDIAVDGGAPEATQQSSFKYLSVFFGSAVAQEKNPEEDLDANVTTARIPGRGVYTRPNLGDGDVGWVYFGPVYNPFEWNFEMINTTIEDLNTDDGIIKAKGINAVFDDHYHALHTTVLQFLAPRLPKVTYFLRPGACGRVLEYKEVGNKKVWLRIMGTPCPQLNRPGFAGGTNS